MRLILEQRYLFDGSVAATSHHAHHVDHHTLDHHAAAAGPATPPAVDLPRAAPPLAHAPDRAPDRVNDNLSATQIQPATPAQHDLLFVDPRVANWRTLADSVPKSVAVIVLDPAKDGLSQITDTLATRTGVKSIQVLSYGKSGEVDLGATPINAATLSANAAELAGWKDHLAPHAQIDLYGCDVGAGAAGRAFVDQLHALTGVGVAASTDATGATALGGDWTLEQRAGVDHVRTPFSQAAIHAYTDVLDAPRPTLTFSYTTDAVVPGTSFIESVVLQNTASAAIGYGPFVDVFVPHNATESATLATATYQGASLGITPVTLSSTIAGHEGVVGALHPAAAGTDGASLFVAAPAGFAAGDTLYVVTLPLNNLAPGVASAKVDLTFAVAGSSQTSTTLSGAALGIAAVGGFQFGADPASAHDPSVRGTGQSATVSDAANGAVATTTAVDTVLPPTTLQYHDPTYTSTVTIPVQVTDFTTGTMFLPGFDTTRGTLTDVSVTVAAAQNASGTVRNQAPTAQPSDVNDSTRIRALSADAALNLLDNTVVVDQNYPSIPAGATVAYGPPGGLSNMNSVTRDLGLDTNFNAGSVAFTVATRTGQSFTGGGGNIEASIVTTVGATYTVTYTYLAATVPNPVLTKTVGPSNVPTKDNADPTFPNNTIVIGETRPVTITVQLPNRNIDNAGNHVTVTDLLPAGETFIPGTATITPGAGVTLVGAGGGATVTGNTISFDLGTAVNNTNTDGSGTVTITYNAAFPNGANTDGTQLTSTANLAYNGPAVTPASVTLVEHDPAIVETITDNSGGSLFSNQNVTYTITLKNNGVVSGDSLVDNAIIPTGLTFVPGSFMPVTGGTTPTVDASNPADLKAGLASLLPGQTATFSFQATVNPNQPAGTTLTVASTAAESTYHSIPTAIGPGRTYTLAATDPQSIATVAATLSIVGEANGTATPTPSDAAPVTTANVTVGDIVRLHATVNVPEGANPATVLDFTLPAGLTYANDGSTRIALVSPNGSFTSSTLDATGTTPGLQQTSAAVGSAANFAPTFTVPAGAIDTTTVPGHVRISLGTIANNAGSPLLNNIVLEFNGIVANAAGIVNATTLAETVAVLGATSNTVTETVKEPTVGITKTATAIDGTTGTITNQVTLTNTGTATAYGVTLNDPQPANENPITGLTTTGTGTGVVILSGNGTNNLISTLTLAPGASETFTYQVQATNLALPIPAATATENYRDLVTQIIGFAGTTSGPSGTPTGSRDGTTPPLALNTYNGAVSTPSLGSATGRVYQALGNTPGTFDPLIDTPLAGVTVTGRTAGPDGIFGTPDDVIRTATTAPDGTYVLGLLPNGAVQITLPTPGAGGLPAAETLVYDPRGSTATVPPTATGITTGTVLNNTDFGFQAPDTAPVLGNFSTGTRTLPNGGAVPLSSTGAATVVDTELNRLVAANEGYTFAGTNLVIQRTVAGAPAPNATDTFSGDPTLTLAGGNVTLAGTVVGTFTQAGGVLSITFNAAATAPTVAAVLDHVTYSNAAANPPNTVVTIGATLADGNTTGIQGTGGVMTSIPVLASFNLNPVIPATTATFTEPNDTPPAAAAIPIAPTFVLPAGIAPGATVSQATIAFTAGFVPAQDVLAFTPTAATGDITATFAAGVLTLTSPSGTATAAQFQAAVDAVQYFDTSDQPTTAPRALTVSLTDKATSTTNPAQTITLNVIPVNDSPILNTAVPVALAPSTEDVSAPPAGPVGTLVSVIDGLAINVTDPDGANANNGSPVIIGGIAIVGADTSLGNFYFTTNNGTTWTQFAGPGLPPISAANALHLVGDANTRIYFQPTVANFNGAVPNALQFRAWDRFDPVPNGTLSALPADSALGTGINTLASSYSAAVKVLPVTVVAVNDAPVATGTATLAPTPEDTANPPGATVATLFTPTFTDTVDQQMTGTNPTGSIANTLAGVAIVGNPTPASEGVWRYSLDGGNTFINLPANLSDTNALILSSSAKIDFLPAPNFNGAPLPLTVRLIDSSTDVPITPGVTGATLAATTQAIPGVNVGGANDGGITAISANTVPLNTTVPPVNDAPIATGTSTLPTVPEDTLTPVGTSVTTLFGSNFTDGVDNQKTAINPTGSLPNTLAGIAIVNNASTPAQGTYRYSTDGGVTYTDIPRTVADNSALILPNTALIIFVPAPNYNGTPGQLAVRLIDNSADLPVTGPITGALLAGSNASIANVDVSGPNDGGITAISAGVVPLAIKVSPVNDAPVATGNTTIPAVPENTTNPPGTSVTTLLTPIFTDTTDQQFGPTNPTGSTANTLAGVAITGNASTPAQGTYRYSTDGGVTYTPFPTNLSDSNALVLGGPVLIQFLPAPNFSGMPGGLTTRLIDTSTDIPVFGTTTGANLATTPIAAPGIDLSGPHQGGITAVSANIAKLDTFVIPTDISPLNGKPAILPTIFNGDPSPGQSVLSLYGPNFSSPAGNAFTGIVIVGDSATPAQGYYRYSLDGGATFTPVPIGSSVSAGLMLPVNAILSFVPAPGFVGVPGGLTSYLIGGTSTFVSPGLRGSDVGSLQIARTVDVSSLIGNPTAPITASTVGLSITILQRAPARSDAPAQPGEPVQPSGTPFLTSNPDTDRNRDYITADPFGFRDDLLQRDGRPQGHEDWLVGSELRRFIIIHQVSIVDISENLFYATNPAIRLEYRAQLPGGVPLPSWLSFDPRNLTLVGTPPSEAEGTLDVQIIARDEDGRTALGEVHLRISRPSRDLLALLRTPEAKRIRIPAALRAGPGRTLRGNTARPAAAPPAGQRPGNGATDKPPANPGESPATQPATPRQGAELAPRHGLSNTLRNLSAAGKAHALLAALSNSL